MRVVERLRRQYRVKVFHNDSITSAHVLQKRSHFANGYSTSKNPISSVTSGRLLLGALLGSFTASCSSPFTLFCVPIFFVTPQLERLLPIIISSYMLRYLTLGWCPSSINTSPKKTTRVWKNYIRKYKLPPIAILSFRYICCCRDVAAVRD